MKLKKQILLLTTKYPLAADSSWLSSDLAEKLSRDGWRVFILFLDWNSVENGYQNRVVRKNRVIVLRQRSIISPLFRFAFISKWFLTSVYAYFNFIKFIRLRKFHAIICFSPVVTVWFLLLALKGRARKILLIYWDFFPIHHIQIGLIKNPFLKKFLFLFEKYLVSKFGFIGCMSQRNMDFLANYFSIRSDVIHEVPLWGGAPVKQIDLSNNTGPLFDTSKIIRCVFGGQLAAGRGVSFLAKLISKISNNRYPIHVTVIGSGPEESKIDVVISSAPEYATRIPAMSRNAYLHNLYNFDVGLIVTVGGVSVPTYPSKIIDYTSVGLPVVAAVEEESDFPFYIKYYGSGSCTAVDDLDSFIGEILRFSDPYYRSLCVAGSLRMFHERHSQNNSLRALTNFLKENNS